MMQFGLKRLRTGIIAFAVALGIFISGTVSAAVIAPLPVHAEADYEAGDQLSDDGHVINPERANAQKQEAIQSNEVDGWPEGPAITAKGAILMDAGTDAILYSKNIHDRLYPASTTKLLTCLIAVERLNLDDTITLSETAKNAVPIDGSNIGMEVGESISFEEALYAILVGSANEVADAVAEKTAGSMEAFADLMNEKAAELGCQDSHFVNPSGLSNEDHYTSAYDLCLIAKAFFQNETLLNIGNTPSYHFEATETQPDDFTITNKHELITGKVACHGVIGGKTGYTDESGQTLVTGCERNGTRMICVVMKEDDPAQYYDTADLFDYGFSNFEEEKAADVDTTYTISLPDFMETATDFLGTSAPPCVISEDGILTMPVDASFEDITTDKDSNEKITYTFGTSDNGIYVGCSQLLHTVGIYQIADPAKSGPSLLKRFFTAYASRGTSGILYINIIPFLITFMAAAFLIIFTISGSAAANYARRRKNDKRRASRKRTGTSGRIYGSSHSRSSERSRRSYSRSDRNRNADRYERQYDGRAGHRDETVSTRRTRSIRNDGYYNDSHYNSRYANDRYYEDEYKESRYRRSEDYEPGRTRRDFVEEDDFYDDTW